MISKNKEELPKGPSVPHVSIWALIHFSDGALSSNQTVVDSIKIRTFWESLFINDQSLCKKLVYMVSPYQN